MHCCETRSLHPPIVYQYSITIPGSIKPIVATGTDACVEDGGLCIFNSEAMILAFTPSAWSSMKTDPILPVEATRRCQDKFVYFSDDAYCADAATDEPCSGDYDGL